MNGGPQRQRRRKVPDTGDSASDGVRGQAGRRRFVIHQHDASTLHFDFRLEVGAVLVSWAVPKGLSTDPREKRLAIRTEDHRRSYADFEGVIPEGEYGAGTVLLWDRGSYRNLRARKGPQSMSMERSLDDGLIEVELQGQKLEGSWALKRIREGEQSEWLVIKMKDSHADARRRPASTEPRSVISGRTLEDIAAQARGDA